MSNENGGWKIGVDRQGRAVDWVQLSHDLRKLIRRYRACTIEEREDVCQTILLRLLRYRAMPRHLGPRWLGRVVLNGVRDVLRNKKYERRYVDRRFPVDTIGLAQAQKYEEYLIKVAVAPHAHESELRYKTWRAISELPQPQRQVCALIIDGLQYSEIASLLDCPVGTVRSRLHYAVEKLQAQLLEIK